MDGGYVIAAIVGFTFFVAIFYVLAHH